MCKSLWTLDSPEILCYTPERGLPERIESRREAKDGQVGKNSGRGTDFALWPHQGDAASATIDA